MKPMMTTLTAEKVVKPTCRVKRAARRVIERHWHIMETIFGQLWLDPIPGGIGRQFVAPNGPAQARASEHHLNLSQYATHGPPEPNIGQRRPNRRQ